MNKIFTTLLLLLCAVAVNAQTQITSVDQIKTTKVYVLTTSERGALAASYYNESLYLNDQTSKHDVSYDDAYQQFGFLKINGKLYLYNKAREVFATMPSSGSLIKATEEPLTPVTLQATSDGKFTIALGEVAGKNLVNLNSEYQAVVGDDNLGAGNQFTIYELSTTSYYSYTANLKIGEKIVKTKHGLIETSWPTIYPLESWQNGFVSITPDYQTISEDGQEVEFTGTLNLPFASSPSFETATWYQMKLSNDDNKYVKYVADGSPCTLGTADKTAEYLWAFNAENPYSIIVYNLAAGKDKALHATETNPTMGEGTDQAYWALAYASYNGFALKADGTSNYLADDNGALGYKTQAYGSTDVAISLTQPTYNASDVSVGTKWGDVANNQYAQDFTNNPNAVTYDAWKKHAEYVGSNGYVTLHIGAADGKNIGLDTETYLTASDKAGDDDNADAATDVSQLWEVTSVAQGKVRIKNVSTDKYIQQATSFTQLGAEPFDYSISWDGEGKVFCLHNNDASSTDDYFQYKKQYDYVSFVAGSDQTNAQFSFSPVSTLKNAMHTTESGVSYSTLYMPFDVKLEDGFTAYTAKLNGDHFDLTSLGQNVPAETAVVIEGPDNASWATFSKADGVSAADKGELKGTAVPMTWDEYHFWSLGNGGGIAPAGFYAWRGTTLPAGRAYFDATNVSTTSAKGAAFGTETTGLDKLLRDATVIPANAQRYNLAGQRVDKNYKGVVVVNGKKMLQK